MKWQLTLAVSLGACMTGPSFGSDVATQKDNGRYASRAAKEQLLDGLEGYPAASLAEAFRKMPARLRSDPIDLRSRIDDCQGSPPLHEQGICRYGPRSEVDRPK